jgi:hypothetical protein
MQNAGLSATDLVPKIATDTFFSNIETVSVNGVSAIPFTSEWNSEFGLTDVDLDDLTYEEAERYMPLAIDVATQKLSS